MRNKLFSDFIRPHPRPLSWLGTSAMAMGGSNQSLFLITALFVGQGAIPGQGSAAVPLLILGLLLSYAAAPAWTELVLMSPRKVGGIAAACTEAFRPYSSVLSALTGVCYWWGWVPTCGLTAILSASAIHQWYLHEVPVPLLACSLVLFFTAVNLCGVKWVGRLAIPIATASAVLAFASAVLPVVAGLTDWRKATDFSLTTPFGGMFGQVTSIMAGLYLIGFAAPAFEAAACHVGEMRDPAKSLPRSMLASGAMAAMYFLVLPMIWLGTLGSDRLGHDLALELGPTFAPLVGGLGKSAALWFMMFNMFHGTLQPLAGASRTLSQLSDDGLLPRFLSKRSATDCPWAATLMTAGFAIAFLLIGDPIWLIAAANFTYLISICMPTIAAWLLRKDAPGAERPFRAPKGMILLGVIASAVWLLSAVLGFQQFGLPTVLIGLTMGYSGAALYAWRQAEDRVRAGKKVFTPTLHFTLTGAMLLVLVLDGVGYLIAVNTVPQSHAPLRAALEDIFVAVALLTFAVGLVLPGVIAHSATQIADAARALSSGAIGDFSRAMTALGRGDLEGAHATLQIEPVRINSRDELGQMADSFNMLQTEVVRASEGLAGARESLRASRNQLTSANAELKTQVESRTNLLLELTAAKEAAEAANAAKGQFLSNMSHELRTPLNGIIGLASILNRKKMPAEERQQTLLTIESSAKTLHALLSDVLDFSKIEANGLDLREEAFVPAQVARQVTALFAQMAADKGIALSARIEDIAELEMLGDEVRFTQLLTNMLSNAVKFTDSGSVELHMGGRDDGEAVRLTTVLSDTGIGVSAQMRPHLFERFRQADDSNTRSHGGTGLGLAISRSLARLMGGDITLDERPGPGSSFRFTCRLSKADARSITHPAEPSVRASAPDSEALARPLNVLLVEDHPVNRRVVALMLSDSVQLDQATDGERGVEAALARDYDVILMDMQMPIMDGLTAIRLIRKAEQDMGRSRSAIVMLTANANAEAVAASAAAGADGHLTKPITSEALFAEIARVTSIEQDRSAAVPTGRARRA